MDGTSKLGLPKTTPPSKKLAVTANGQTTADTGDAIAQSLITALLRFPSTKTRGALGAHFKPLNHQALKLVAERGVVILVGSDGRNRPVLDLHEVQAQPEIITKVLERARQGNVFAGKIIDEGDSKELGTTVSSRSPMSDYQEKRIVKINLTHAKVERAKTAEGYIGQLTEMINKQFQERKNKSTIKIPKALVPEFIYYVSPGDKVKTELNSPSTLESLATALKESIYAEDLPIPEYRFDRLASIFGKHHKDIESKLGKLETILGKRVFANIANKTTNPGNGGELEDYYNLVSKLLTILDSFQPDTSNFSKMKTFKG